MNKLFNIHASAVMAARDHAEKQINGKSKQMFWFMTDFETKTVSLACKRCKLQVRYLLKRMKYPLPKAGENMQQLKFQKVKRASNVTQVCTAPTN